MRMFRFIAASLYLMRFLILLFCLVFAICAHPCNAQIESDLPIFVISTNGEPIVNEPKTIVDLGIIYKGEGQRNSASDPFNAFDGKIAIEIRGSSSQMFPKKQYGFEIVDDSGIEYDTSLLGLPSESDWVLFAPYNDKTLMRDVLAYHMASLQGHYAPRTRYCELILNGSYNGVYVLIEKIKRDKQRVDIARLTLDDNEGDDVTGGYIIKIDKLTGDSDHGWYSDFPPPEAAPGRYINFLYEYPDAGEITNAQRNYIQTFMKDFETNLQSDDFADPIDGYSKYIDVNSFIDFMIINEISKNVDGYRLSTYFHKQKNSDGGKLVMGPVWDFNLGFGNADYCTKGDPNGLVLDFNRICPTDTWLIPFWWKRLLQDPNYKQKLQARWEDLRADKFSTTSIVSYIDSVATSLDEAQHRNFVRWPVLGIDVWPNDFVGETYQQEVTYLKSWVELRMNWLDNYFLGLVSSNESGPGIRINPPYPNPSSSGFLFEIRAARESVLTIEIFDALGRKVENLHVPLHSGSNSVEVGQKLSAGNYYYTMRTGEKDQARGKIFKK
jgi:hypothetical protein